MKGINKVLRMVKNECNRIVCKKTDGKVVNYKGFQSWYTVGSKLMLSGRVWGDYVRCMPAAREGAIGGNERSLFNHVFIFSCYMTPFVSLGVWTLDVCLCFLHFKSFSLFWFSSPSLLVGLFSVAPCRSSLLLHRFSIIFFYMWFYTILYVSIFFFISFFNWSKIFIFFRYLNIFFFFCYSTIFFLIICNNKKVHIFL